MNDIASLEVSNVGIASGPDRQAPLVAIVLYRVQRFLEAGSTGGTILLAWQGEVKYASYIPTLGFGNFYVLNVTL